MPSRAIEIRRDRDSTSCVPVLLVEESDQALARIVAEAMAGRVQVVLARAPEGEFVLARGGAPGPGLSEHQWSSASGWAFRLGPAMSGAGLGHDVPDWRSAHILVETQREDGTAIRTAYPLPSCDGEHVTIGRGTSSDVCLADRAVSRSHLRISRIDGCYKLTDIRPAQGDSERKPTLLDRSPLPISGPPTVIGHGSVILIGHTRIQCHVPESALGPFAKEQLIEDLRAAERDIGDRTAEELARRRAMDAVAAEHAVMSPQGVTAPKPPPAPIPEAAAPDFLPGDLSSDTPRADPTPSGYAERQAAGGDPAAAQRRQMATVIVVSSMLLLLLLCVVIAWVFTRA